MINITDNDGVLTTSSKEVALNFGKEHGKVLRSVENIMLNEPSQNWLRYFIPNEYTDLQGKPRKEYLLTRDGFALIVMGFTGAKALQWKLKYIDAFNQMEEALKSAKYTIDPAQLQCIKEVNKTLRFIQDKSLRDNIARQVLAEMHDIEIPISNTSTSRAIKIDESVVDFINAQCERSEGANAKINVFHECYVFWCKLNKLKPLTKVCFGRHMRLLGFEQEHRHVGRLWKGIKINS
ncbi:MAG: Rha family transcriptional regulator [Bacillota bacterium]|nr:Rha family transcriptional regulator [Bacillota bacterium]